MKLWEALEKGQNLLKRKNGLTAVFEGNKIVCGCALGCIYVAEYGQEFKTDDNTEDGKSQQVRNKLGMLRPDLFEVVPFMGTTTTVEHAITRMNDNNVSWQTIIDWLKVRDL